MTPEDIQTQFNAAIELHTNGNLEEAMRRYDAILGADPTYADALHLKGLAMHQQGDSAGGAQWIERAIVAKPHEAAYRSNLGSVYKSLGETAKAIEQLERAVELDADFLPALYNVAELYCDRGDVAQGERAYRRAIEINRGLPDIWTNLGLCLVKQEKLDEADSSLLQALELKGDFAPALYGLAHLRELQQRSEEAKTFFGQAMRFGFDKGSCLRRLATIAQAESEPEESIGYLEQLVAIGEADANVYNNMALAYQDLEDADKERQALDRALELDANHVESLCNYAAYQNRQGNFAEAIELSRRAIEEDPKCDIAFNNLGASFKGQAKLEDAIEAYKRAIALRSDRAEYYNNLAIAQEYSGKIVEMEQNFREAIRLDSNYVNAFANYGSALLNFGRLTEAKSQLDRALIIDANHIVAWNNQARYYYEIGSFKESVRAYRRFLTIDPKNHLALTSLAATQVIRDDIDEAQVFEAHKESAHRIEESVAPFSSWPAATDRSPDRPLRVGFVSADFRLHSVAFFLEPLFDHLDPKRYSIYCYSGVRNKDAVTRRLESRASIWRDVCDHPDDALANLIRDDRIDALVDLGGYTAGNRAKVFAMRPAPIQIAWLGYPHSTGMSRMDYRIVDSETDPEGLTLNSETLIRLPECFLCFRPSPDAPEVGPLPAQKNGYITFGSFNNATKLTAKSIELFAGALLAVPGAKLLLKSHQAADPTVQRKLITRFETLGVAADRLEFSPKFPKMADHLAAYNRVDIALDTYPYNGTTTTCEALWMGVPVVTLRGARHAARVSGSLLTAIGMSDYAADSEEAFIALAKEKAGDLAALAATRSGLRERVRSSPLRNEEGFAQRFGEALDAIANAGADR